ncbi:substrate-binding domain-containing protein [Cryptosporangium phraense]|uniref:VWA domain-containing protein n=1 Tax=Cryptosporangium phraense TaxID=2593070 RepID=A0A545B097_9ACTN|nr:substrate-binding domain-containing protein [Cryptosporangium phraense]TQS46265.1 VWA domain-containing protein [Cryptosporangium phraense]
MRLLLAAVALLLVAACTGPDGKPGYDPSATTSSGAAVTLRVLAGSELSDMKPVLEKIKEQTGVTVELDYTGTLDGAESVANGSASKKYDAVWFSSNRYLTLLPEARSRIGTQQKIMTSPVVLGLRQSAVQRLGWTGKPVSWAQIAEAASARKFSFGMTDPSASNTGFSTLIGVAAALSGAGDALSTKDIDRVAPRLRSFFAGQALTAGSSGWLSEAYLRRTTGNAPGGAIDGLFNYESVLLSLNAGGKLPEPLSIVYPSDGVVTADYPFTLLKSASPAAKIAYDTVSGALRSKDMQQRILSDTRRRPIDPTVALPPSMGNQTLIELPFPAKREVVDDLLISFQNTLRRPSRTVYVLDTSGSMDGDRITGLKSALTGLTGADTSVTGRFARFRSREEVTLLAFNSSTQPPISITVPPSDTDAALARIRTAVAGLKADGGTAIYKALDDAYRLIAATPGQGDAVTSIVLMTDGENTSGQKYDDFVDDYGGRPASQRAIPIYPVLFGESATDQMENLAKLSGGRTFDARNGTLNSAFKEIRGYQ